MPKTDERLLGFAKQLRQEMTTAEARLWYHLRAKQLNSVKFVRQSVRRPYIADFVARSHKLIVEVDGDTHGAAHDYDARRTALLERDGYRVIRLNNADVMNNEEGVLNILKAALSNCPSPRPSPQRGEGERRELPLPSGAQQVNRPPDGLGHAGGMTDLMRVAERSEVGRGAVTR